MAFTVEQRSAIEWYKGPLMVLGTPGSGKTTVIVNRVKNLIDIEGVSPENILVITFTRAAAESMKNRFLELTGVSDTKVRFGTFHSFFYWIIRTAYGDKLKLSVMDEQQKKGVLREILRKIDKESYDNEEILVSVINQLQNMSCNVIDIDNYHSRDLPDDHFRTIYYSFNEYKRAKGLIDFDDMVSMCYKLLSDRKDILDAIRHMYPYIMVDEYQDTNLIQYQILKMLAHPSDNIFVVGDDDQSIYGFRGARPDIMKQFEKEFPKSQVLQLSVNHRCPKDVVKLSSEIINRNKNRFKKNLVSGVSRKGFYQILSVPDAAGENSSIIKRIKAAHTKGIAYSDIAVLYRTNIGPRRLMYKLRLSNIPFTVRDTIPDIFSNPYVKPIISYIRYALGDHSRALFLDFMNKPVRYISRDMLTKEKVELSDILKQSRDKGYLQDNIRRLSNELRTISKLGPYGSVNYIRRAIDYDSYLKKYANENSLDYEDIMSTIQEFQDLLVDVKSFQEMFEMLEDTKEIERNTEGDRVQLMTLHSAKGLEFSQVHIMDAVEGIIPHRRSKTEAELEEECRLLYVGITRSKDSLYIYVPKRIGEKDMTLSRFLKAENGEKGGINRNKTGNR